MIAARRRWPNAQGFTLIELMLALMLMAGMASDSLRLAQPRRREAGTAARRRPSKSPTCGLRRRTCAPSSPSSIRSGCGRRSSSRCCSPASAERAALRRGAAGARRRRRRLLLPARRRRAPARSRSSCRSASFPILAALQAPEFRDAERSVLADGIAELQDRLFRPRRQCGRRRRADVARSLGRPATPAAPRCAST